MSLLRTIDRRSALLGMFALTATGCAGAGAGSITGNSRSAQALQQIGLTTTPAPVLPSSPMTFVQGSGTTPVYSTASNSTFAAVTKNGYTFQTAPDASFTNVFDANGVFHTQIESATSGANGMPNLRFVGSDGSWGACNLIDVSHVPENTVTTIGSATILYSSSAGTASVTMNGQTVSTAYDASGAIVATLPDGSTLSMGIALLASPAAAQSLGRKNTQEFVNSKLCNGLYLAAAALALAIIAALVLAAGCFAAAWWAAWACAISLKDVLTALGLLLGPIIVLINKECTTPVKPPAPPVPAVPGPGAGPVTPVIAGPNALAARSTPRLA